jgi:hypothetical protein
MRSAAGAGDDHLVAGSLRAAGEGIQPFGRAVGRNDARVMADLELVEGGGGMLHHLPVGLAAHDDGNRWGRRRRQGNLPELWAKARS